MEEGLFKKYQARILKNKKEKQDIIDHIQLTTDISLEESELAIEGKKVQLYTTSTKRSALNKKNVQIHMKEKGYTLI